MAQHDFSITRIQAKPKQQHRHTIFTATVVALSCLAVSLSAQAACQEGCLGNENTVLGDFALLNSTGGARAPRRFIGWQTFFDFGGTYSADVRPNKRIDTIVSTPLFHLPLGTIFNGMPPDSLMQRNLLRCLTWKLPSGQRIAQEMGIPSLSNAELAELQSIRPSFVTDTPLFYYILKEAQLREDGLRLGPVGARIVAEVFIGLLQLDPDSYFSVQPDWLPTLPTHDGTPQSFRMIDFPTFAGVDPTSRGQ